MLFVDLWQSPIVGFTHYETCLNNSYNAKSRNNKNNIGVIGFAIFDEKGVMIPREVVSNITRDESSSRYESRAKSMEMNGMQVQEPLSSNQIQSLNYHELKHVDSCFTGNSPRLLRNNFL